MVKSSDNEGTRILYKKSFTSYLKTSSIFSNQTRLVPMKKKMSNHKGFYSDGGKVKRDLSIETDFCKVRRRFKHLLKISNGDAASILTSRSPKSAKSRYSNYTEIEAIEEFDKDFCASGDNSQTHTPNNSKLNKEDLMYNNLNCLIKSWIQHILEDQDLKNMIQKTFEAAFQETGSNKVHMSSSCVTYVLDKNRFRTSASSEHCYSYNNKTTTDAYLTDQYSSDILQSYNTIPILYKYIRLISTLSLPRNFHKRDKRRKRKKNKTRVKKAKHRKVLATFIQPNKYLVESSNTNIDLFAISTKSWLKECANVDEKRIRNELLKGNLFSTRRISPENRPVLIENRYRTANAAKSVDLKPITSLVDSFFESHTELENINNCNSDVLKTNDYCTKTCPKTQHSETKIKTSTSINKIHRNDTGMAVFMTENHGCVKNGNSPQLKNAINLNDRIKREVLNTIVDKTSNDLAKNVTYKLDELRHREFTYQHSKINKQKDKDNDLLKHLQEVLEYYEKIETVKDMRLDIHVNVFPKYHDSNSASNSDFSKSSKKPTIVYSVIPKRLGLQKKKEDKTDIPKIIPILDGAVSQTKYLLNIENSLVQIHNEANSIKIDQSSMTNTLGIKEELHEIKAVLKQVSVLVQQFCPKKIPGQLIASTTFLKTSKTKTAADKSISENNLNICPMCCREFSEKSIRDIILQNFSQERAKKKQTSKEKRLSKECAKSIQPYPIKRSKDERRSCKAKYKRKSGMCTIPSCLLVARKKNKKNKGDNSPSSLSAYKKQIKHYPSCLKAQTKQPISRKDEIIACPSLVCNQDAKLDNFTCKRPSHECSCKHKKSSSQSKKSVTQLDKNVKRCRNLKKDPLPGIQISKKVNELSQSGFKLSMHGRRSPAPIKKKLPSNRLIESKSMVEANSMLNNPNREWIASESLIEVTDMTTNSYRESVVGKTVDIALTCCPPEKESLYEVSREEARSLTYADGTHSPLIQSSLRNCFVQQAINTDPIWTNVNRQTANSDVESYSKHQKKHPVCPASSLTQTADNDLESGSKKLKMPPVRPRTSLTHTVCPPTSSTHIVDGNVETGSKKQNKPPRPPISVTYTVESDIEFSSKKLKNSPVRPPSTLSHTVDSDVESSTQKLKKRSFFPLSPLTSLYYSVWVITLILFIICATYILTNDKALYKYFHKEEINKKSKYIESLYKLRLAQLGF